MPVFTYKPFFTPLFQLIAYNRIHFSSALIHVDHKGYILVMASLCFFAD